MGSYCSYLLPKQDGGTSQIQVNPTQLRDHQNHPVMCCEQVRMIFPMQLRDEPGDLRAAEPRHPERDHAGPLPAQERRHAGTAQEELPEEDQHGRRLVKG